MEKQNAAPSAEEATPAEQKTETASYTQGQLSFDPTKDLNLPGSYAEVTERFKRLQGKRAMEVLN